MCLMEFLSFTTRKYPICVTFGASKSTMFLNQLKDFSTKKIVKNQLPDSCTPPSDSKVETVGILFDETYVVRHDEIIEELVKNGIKRENISILVYRAPLKKNETVDYPFFTPRNFSWTATIKKQDVQDFLARHYDLLISYYDVEKAPLLLISHLTKAGFKVGFSSVDKRVHHFMIDTVSENYKLFTDELFKYLKILNKIA